MAQKTENILRCVMGEAACHAKSAHWIPRRNMLLCTGGGDVDSAKRQDHQAQEARAGWAA